MADQTPNTPPDITGPHNVRLDQWISCAPFERLLNMTIVKAENGKATLTMPFYVDYAQGAGLMHGGALVSLADTAVGMAIKSILPPKTHFATISLHSEFLYPVKQGHVTARAEIEIEAERTIHGTATVCNEDGRSVLEFKSTFKIARERKIRTEKE